jgi:DNA-binding GntR family transcriptional regulator
MPAAGRELEPWEMHMTTLVRPEVDAAAATTPRREKYVDAIIDLALDGELVPGTIRSEKTIAEAVAQVGGGQSPPSRTPIREALALLVRDGVFDQEPQRGVMLRPLTADEVDPLMATRRGLEVFVARRLAVAPDKHLGEATTARDRACKALEADDRKAYEYADLLFHCGLARGAGMRAAEGTLRGVLSRLRLFGAGHSLDYALAQAEVHAFSGVLQAIERSDPEEADARMITCIDYAHERVRAYTSSLETVSAPTSL